MTTDAERGRSETIPLSKKRLAGLVAIAVVALAADQLTKWWARATLKSGPGLTIIDGYFDLRYYENSGMAFSLGQGLPRLFFIVVGIVVLFVVWRVVRQVKRRQQLATAAFALVAGGAVGNLVDRVHIGRVVDFIVMHWQHKYVWPAYNIADASLCVGVGLLVVAISGEPKDPPKA